VQVHVAVTNHPPTTHPQLLSASHSFTFAARAQSLHQEHEMCSLDVASELASRLHVTCTTVLLAANTHPSHALDRPVFIFSFAHDLVAVPDIKITSPYYSLLCWLSLTPSWYLTIYSHLDTIIATAQHYAADAQPSETCVRLQQTPCPKRQHNQESNAHGSV
jgi:hypothetical protein